MSSVLLVFCWQARHRTAKGAALRRWSAMSPPHSKQVPSSPTSSRPRASSIRAKSRLSSRAERTSCLLRRLPRSIRDRRAHHSAGGWRVADAALQVVLHLAPVFAERLPPACISRRGVWHGCLPHPAVQEEAWDALSCSEHPSLRRPRGLTGVALGHASAPAERMIVAAVPGTRRPFRFRRPFSLVTAGGDGGAAVWVSRCRFASSRCARWL